MPPHATHPLHETLLFIIVFTLTKVKKQEFKAGLNKKSYPYTIKHTCRHIDTHTHTHSHTYNVTYIVIYGVFVFINNMWEFSVHAIPFIPVGSCSKHLKVHISSPFGSTWSSELYVYI